MFIPFFKSPSGYPLRRGSICILYCTSCYLISSLPRAPPSTHAPRPLANCAPVTGDLLSVPRMHQGQWPVDLCTCLSLAPEMLFSKIFAWLGMHRHFERPPSFSTESQNVLFSNYFLTHYSVLFLSHIHQYLKMSCIIICSLSAPSLPCH